MLAEFKDKTQSFMNVDKLRVGYGGIDEMIRRMAQSLVNGSAVGVRRDCEGLLRADLGDAKEEFETKLNNKSILLTKKQEEAFKV